MKVTWQATELHCYGIFVHAPRDARPAAPTLLPLYRSAPPRSRAHQVGQGHEGRTVVTVGQRLSVQLRYNGPVLERTATDASGQSAQVTNVTAAGVVVTQVASGRRGPRVSSLARAARARHDSGCLSASRMLSTFVAWPLEQRAPPKRRDSPASRLPAKPLPPDGGHVDIDSSGAGVLHGSPLGRTLPDRHTLIRSDSYKVCTGFSRLLGSQPSGSRGRGVPCRAASSYDDVCSAEGVRPW
jgi:hypothetical protein